MGLGTTVIVLGPLSVKVVGAGINGGNLVFRSGLSGAVFVNIGLAAAGAGPGGLAGNRRGRPPVSGDHHFGVSHQYPGT